MFGLEIAVMVAAVSVLVSAVFSLFDSWVRARRHFKVRIGSKDVELVAGKVEENLDRLRPVIQDMQKHPRVFLSYSGADLEFAEKLVSDLERRGIPVWFGRREITVGDKLVSKIGEGIDQSQWVIPILSPEATSSSWFRRELQVALQHEERRKRRLILPVLYKGDNLPPELTDRVYADFRSNYEEGMDALVSAIRRHS